MAGPLRKVAPAGSKSGVPTSSTYPRTASFRASFHKFRYTNRARPLCSMPVALQHWLASRKQTFHRRGTTRSEVAVFRFADDRARLLQRDGAAFKPGGFGQSKPL
jgi:hypothetical protein